jgi:glyoxylase-like metal-dependent hydrolase (beta-lactamase superfamily II)
MRSVHRPPALPRLRSLPRGGFEAAGTGYQGRGGRVIDPPGQPRDTTLSVAGLEITVLEAGTARHPGAWVGPPPSVADWLWSPINVVLVRDGTETLLVDTAIGELGSWWPHEGLVCDLDGALARAGCSRGDVDRIVMTHLDFDHAGGLVSGAWPDGLVPAFDGVHVHVLSEAIGAARRDDPDAPLNAGTRVIAALHDAGLLVEIDDGTTIAPGVTLRSAPGHRPGHAIVELGSADEKVVFLADVLHHPLHAGHPEWDALADENVPLALATRRRILAELADTGTLVFAAHISAAEPLLVRSAGDAWIVSPRTIASDS